MEKICEIDKEIKNLLIKVGASLCIVSTSGYILKYVWDKVSYKRILKKKQKILERKKHELFEKLETLKKPFDTMEEITSISLEELIKRLDSGVYNSKDVLHVFQTKALLMDREYNFITDLNPNVESDILASSRHKGLLKGIPISIKDVFYIKDCDCTYGMADHCFKPSNNDSILVQCIRLQGGIPFVMTNMSQTGKSIESSNPIFGETLNPHNKKRTCGGSSGGEGAILAAGASILGLGGDIGGSIRIPSSYCGIFGLKPTSGRLSRRNTRNLFPNQDFIKPSVGPMARRFEDLLTFFKALVCEDMHSLDPLCPPLSFNEDIFNNKRPLRIGYYTHLGESQVKSIPAVVRAVNLAKTALESAGHTLLEFQIPNVDKAMFELYLQCLFTDGGYGFTKKLIKRNPVDSSLSLIVTMLQLPNMLKKVLSYLIYPFNKGYSHILYAMAGVSSVYNLWVLNDKLYSFKEEVLTKWESERLDGIICPVLPITAPPCGTTQYIMDILGYSAMYNVLDYTAGSVPVTKVNQNDIENLLKFYPKDTPTHRKIIELQKDSLDMPVGVQCVTLPWREELCLRIMKDIDINLK